MQVRKEIYKKLWHFGGKYGIIKRIEGKVPVERAEERPVRVALNAQDLYGVGTINIKNTLSEMNERRNVCKEGKIYETV